MKELSKWWDIAEELEEWRVESMFNLQKEATYWAHQFGRIVRDYYPEELTDDIIQNLTRKTGKSRATIFRWVELYDKYPDLQLEINKRGKHEVSIRALLGLSKEKEEKKLVCRHCELHCPLIAQN